MNFIKFTNKLKTKSNSSLVEAIQSGYKALHESYDEFDSQEEVTKKLGEPDLSQTGGSAFPGMPLWKLKEDIFLVCYDWEESKWGIFGYAEDESTENKQYVDFGSVETIEELYSMFAVINEQYRPIYTSGVEIIRK